MIYISLGSNVGNRLNHIQQALAELKKVGFTVRKKSPIIETEALLPEGAPALWNKPFFNMVISGTTQLSPQDLLAQLKIIEKKLGRKDAHLKWAPRNIDLDILLFDEWHVDDENFTIPHKELLNRPFLIHLLALIAPDVHHPITKESFTTLAHQQEALVQCVTRSLVAQPGLVGIVNVTPDSFSDGGCFFNPEKPVSRILQLHADGASVIELGAQSTRPGAQLISSEEEYLRLQAVLEGLKQYIDLKALPLGLDSFSSTTILKLLADYPIVWVNDVKGDLSNASLTAIAAHGCHFVAMHSLSAPPDPKNVIPTQVPPWMTIHDWGIKKIAQLEDCGFPKEKIILDPGVGFSKTAYQSYSLLKTTAQLKSLGVPLCIGHSRKSFINIFNHYDAAQRDIETMAISAYLVDHHVDYLRVHNVVAHQRFLVARQSLGVAHVS